MNAHNKRHDGETRYSGEGPGRPDRIQGRAGAQAYAGQRSVVPDPEFTRSASLNGGGRGGQGEEDFLQLEQRHRAAVGSSEYGELNLLRFERVDNLGAYSIPFGDRPSHPICLRQLTAKG